MIEFYVHADVNQKISYEACTPYLYQGPKNYYANLINLFLLLYRVTYLWMISINYLIN